MRLEDPISHDLMPFRDFHILLKSKGPGFNFEHYTVLVLAILEVVLDSACLHYVLNSPFRLVELSHFCGSFSFPHASWIDCQYKQLPLTGGRSAVQVRLVFFPLFVQLMTTQARDLVIQLAGLSDTLAFERWIPKISDRDECESRMISFPGWVEPRFLDCKK